MLKANDIVEPSGENEILTTSDSFKFILITALFTLFNTFGFIALFKSKFAQTGPGVSWVARPICHISTYMKIKT